MTKDEKQILGEMLGLLQLQSAHIAALEDAAKSPTLGGRQLTSMQLLDLSQKAAREQQDTFLGIAKRIHDLPNT